MQDFDGNLNPPPPPPTPQTPPPPLMPRQQSESITLTCAIIAALVGLIPIPFSDALFIIIIQIVMIYKICDKYQVPMGGSIVLVLVSAVIGPIIFSGLTKFLPILGSLVGAAVAGTCTYLVGKTIINVLEAKQPFSFHTCWAGFKKVFGK
ncbi:MAG: DUF697 domain-containing protein [Deltaproteobacteria bacterium]|jgi:uncharacterized protein (DUF697 family)|nr:DUF697 domain-containing protein [Deltaproteobacteria bacterium]